jgi:hypothetical protein
MRARPQLLALLLPFSASAQDFSVADVLGAAAMAAPMPEIRAACVGACGNDRTGEAFAATLGQGFWGGGKAEPLPLAASARVLPVNLGFQALGPKGAGGRVGGPGILGMGDGRYRVEENSPFLVVIRLETGFVQGRFVLSRDRNTGADTIGFMGRVMENGAWGPMREGLNPGQVAYDAASDRGAVRWSAGGRRQEDTYERGAAGSRAMRITLNGHAHNFYRD